MDQVRSETPMQNDLGIVARWLYRLIDDERLSEQSFTEEQARQLLVKTLGRAERITYGRFQALPGLTIVAKLSEMAVEVPAGLDRVFEQFAKSWQPELPHCPNKSCGLPGIVMKPDMSGIEIRNEGILCPWCKQHPLVRVNFRASFMNWITGQEVPDTTTHDETSVPGARIAIAEAELRKLLPPNFVSMLDEKKLSAIDWMRYLLLEGHQAFGLPHAPLPLLRGMQKLSLHDEDSAYNQALLTTAIRFRDSGKGKQPATITEAPTHQPTQQPHAGVMPSDGWLPHSDILTLQGAIISSGISWEAAKSGLSNSVKASLNHSESPVAAVMVQLGQLNRMQLADRSIPLLDILTNAISLCGGRKEGQTFESLKQKLLQRSQPQTIDRNALFDRIADLLPAQFDVLVFRCQNGGRRIPLSGPSSPQATRASELIRYFENTAGGIEALYAQLSKI